MYLAASDSVLLAEYDLAVTFGGLSRVEAELATGSRLVDPADNPADSQIVALMSGQLGALGQTLANLSQGISLLQIAEGGLEQDVALLQTMQQLAVEAANGTATSQDRTDLQGQLQALLSQLDQNAVAVQYNGIALLNGQSVSFGPATLAGVSSSNWSGYLDQAGNGTVLTAVGGTWNVPAVSGTSGAMVSQWIGLGGFGNSDLLQLGTQELVESGGQVSVQIWWEELPGTATVVTTAAVGDLISAAITPVSGAADTWQLTLSVTDPSNGQVTEPLNLRVAVSTTYAAAMGQTAEWITEDPTQGSATGATLYPLAEFSPVTFVDASVDGLALAAGPNPTPVTMVSGASVLVFPSGLNSGGNSFITWEPGTVSAGSLTLQGGDGQTLQLTLPDATSWGLGLTGISLLTQSAAQAAVTTLQSALEALSQQQGTLGSLQDQLQAARQSLHTQAQTLAQSRSSLQDANVAHVIARYARLEILAATGLQTLMEAETMYRLAARLLLTNLPTPSGAQLPFTTVSTTASSTSSRITHPSSGQVPSAFLPHAAASSTLSLPSGFPAGGADVGIATA